MTSNYFTTITSNNLEQVDMFAGSQKTLTYDLYDEDGAPIQFESVASFSVKIFKYGDPTNVFISVSGSPSPIPTLNRYIVTITGSSTMGFIGGLYQQQVLIQDNWGNYHIPAQGKIVIFPGVDY